MSIWRRFKIWLIQKLGGLPQHDCRLRLWNLFPSQLRSAVESAGMKVKKEPGFAPYQASNLGRNILRDEACEWTHHYLRDTGIDFPDRDVHLACELWYQLFGRNERT